MAGVRLGAGLLIAVAVGATAAGWWLPAGVLLAGLLAWCAARQAPDLARGESPVAESAAANTLDAETPIARDAGSDLTGAESPVAESPAANVPGAESPAAGAPGAGPPATASRGSIPARAEPLVGGARLAARLALLSVFGSVFGAYLVPGHSALAAAAFVLVATVAEALGAVVPGFLRAWILGILLVAGAGLVAVCLAISPERGSGGAGPGVTGMFAAAAVMFPLLYRRQPRRNWWLAGSVAAALAVCAAALYQLGPIRLGLSGVPMRDLLAAVDGQAIEPLLAGVVVIATIPAALAALRETRGELPPVAGGVLAAIGAALLDPEQALLLAGALALAEVLVISLLTLSQRRRDVLAVLTAALAITLLAWLPPVYLLLAVAVLAVVAVARTSTGLPARSARRQRPPAGRRT